ncbi:hypothetical protein C8R46DRAFT_1261868 [Mycena filopes]|nr:hypothetical protein C8R46DRAFT_1261868 [Mycena filopes]
MSSHTNNHWDRILHAPPPSLEELAADFPGYSFDTTGWGDDQDIEVLSLPPHMEAGLPLHTGTPSHPTVDLAMLHTPRRTLPTLDTSQLTPFAPTMRLDNLNSFPAYPAVDADEQNALLPYVPAVLRTKHIAAASSRYNADVAANGGYAKLNGEPEVRKAGSGALGVEGEKKRGPGRPRKEKENTAGAGEAASRKFTGEDLIMVVRATVDVNPFLAPHGQKGHAWERVVIALAEQNFRHDTISAASVQHKAEALISYKKNPSGKHKNLANIIGEGTSASITIGALLERLETQHDEAKDKSDEAKAKLKKKADEDNEGGEAIRQASMRTLRKRARSPDSDDATDPETDSPSSSARPATAADSSLETIDSDDNDTTNGKKASKKPASKRRRGMRRSTSSEADGLLGLMKAENERRAAHDARVAQSLETFVSDSRTQKNEFTSLLKELVANERKADTNTE